MPDEPIADPSPAAEEVTEQGSSVIESMSGAERDTWLKTGDLPKPKAESAPAAAPEGEAGAAAKPKIEPTPEAGKETQEQAKERARQNAETRKRQLGQEIQDLLEQRRRLREEVATAKPGEPKPAPPAGQPPPAERPKRPRMDQFETLEAYEDALDKHEEALADWKVDQRFKVEREQFERTRTTQSVMQTNQEIRKNWETRLKATKTRHADFDEVVAAGDVPLNPIMDGYLIDSEIGPEVVYYLAKNPAEAERIAKLGPYATARELAKLEMQLSESLKTPAPKTIPGAKPPVTELAGKNAAPEDEVASAVAAKDFPAYMRLANARDKR